LFVLVTLLGVFLGWLSMQVKWIMDRHEALQRVREGHFGRINARMDLDPLVYHVYGAVAAPWSIRILGEVGVARIEWADVSGSDPAANEREFRRLFPEAELEAHRDAGTDFVPNAHCAGFK
jgi:hypothetical protein